jgi:presenilin 1
MPIAVTQGYLIAIGMLVAFWFTKLPEWTTWVLLLAMAAYDVVAVLTPRGPLNLLVELAMERDEDIPALIYEARPTVPAGTMRMPPPQAQMAPRRERRWRRTGAPSQGTALQETPGENAESLVTGPPTEPEVGILGSRLVSATGEAGTLHAFSTAVNENQVSDDDRAPLVQRQSESSTTPQLEHRPRAVNGGSQHLEEDDEHMGLGLSGAIKLGLGDFVFYSVLVGRAAMYDLMTVYACYLAIVAGLGATLVLLAVWKRALPALPISISLGVVFYFLARLIVDPFILDMSSNLVFF